MGMRERCEKLAVTLLGYGRYLDNEVGAIEAFAHEIRNEALEEAASAVMKIDRTQPSHKALVSTAADVVLNLKK
jgi:hypothetical protein